LIHQHKVKFGLSKIIEESSLTCSKLFGVIPYIDPKRFENKNNFEDLSKNYKLDKKSDIYSLGVSSKKGCRKFT
jgi:serine/threonine protein kinase